MQTIIPSFRGDNLFQPLFHSVYQSSLTCLLQGGPDPHPAAAGAEQAEARRQVRHQELPRRGAGVRGAAGHPREARQRVHQQHGHSLTHSDPRPHGDKFYIFVPINI